MARVRARRVWLAVLATVLIQVGILAVVPSPWRLAVSGALLAIWVLALRAIAVSVDRRYRQFAEQRAQMRQSLAEDAPSPDMQAAWRIARAGGGPGEIARVAGVPMALAELMIERARGETADDDVPGGLGP